MGSPLSYCDEFPVLDWHPLSRFPQCRGAIVPQPDLAEVSVEKLWNTGLKQGQTGWAHRGHPIRVEGCLNNKGANPPEPHFMPEIIRATKQLLGTTSATREIPRLPFALTRQTGTGTFWHGCGLPSSGIHLQNPAFNCPIKAYSFAFPLSFFFSSSLALSFNTLRNIFPAALFGISSTNLTPPLNFL